MTAYTLVHGTHFTPKEIEILKFLLPINNQKARGCIDWTFNQIAKSMKCSFDCVAKLFRKLRRYGLLKQIRHGAKKYTRVIKDEIFLYFDKPRQWLKKRLSSDPLSDPPSDPPSDSLPRENDAAIPIRNLDECLDRIEDDNDLSKEKKDGLARENISTGNQEKCNSEVGPKQTVKLGKDGTKSDNLCCVDNQRDALQLFRKNLGKNVPIFYFDKSVLRKLASLSERDIARAAESFTTFVMNERKKKQTIKNPSSALSTCISNLDKGAPSQREKCAQNENKEEIEVFETGCWTDIITNFVVDHSEKFKKGYGMLYEKSKLYIFGDGVKREVPETENGLEDLKIFYSQCKLHGLAT